MHLIITYTYIGMQYVVKTERCTRKQIEGSSHTIMNHTVSVNFYIKEVKNTFNLNVKRR